MESSTAVFKIPLYSAWLGFPYWTIRIPKILGSIIPYNHQATGVSNTAHLIYVSQLLFMAPPTPGPSPSLRPVARTGNASSPGPSSSSTCTAWWISGGFLKYGYPTPLVCRICILYYVMLYYITLYFILYYGHRQNYGEKKTFNLDRRRLRPIFP